MVTTASSTFSAVSSLSPSSSTTTTMVKARGYTCSFPCSNFFRLKPSRLRISQKIGTVPKHVFRVPIVSCLDDNYSEAPSELGPSDVTNDSKAGVTWPYSVYGNNLGQPFTISDVEAIVDFKLPRRSLLVHFTCNTCGERTQKLINRLAYERGTVFVQCAGCLQHHKLIDNLGLVVEYDFREDNVTDSKADQV